MNKYKEALTWIKNDIERSVSTEIYFRKAHENIGILQELIDKEEKYRWHDLRKDPNDLPNGREWVLAIFKDDTDFTLVPRVADYVGKQTPITTKENWIILDLDDAFDLSEYHRNLKCIAWKYIEEFKGE